MVILMLDTRGQKSPHPILKIAAKAPDMKPVDIMEVLADCPSFEKDVRTWCDRLGRVLILVKDEGETKKRIRIQF